MNNHLEHDFCISQELSPESQFKKVRRNIETCWHGKPKLVEKSETSFIDNFDFLLWECLLSLLLSIVRGFLVLL